MKRATTTTTTKIALAAAAALTAAGLTRSAGAATVVWDGGATGNGTAWLTGTNWVGDVVPAADDTIEFQTAGTGGPIGLNLNSIAPPMNTGFHHHTVGSILQSGGRDRTIQNSSGAAAGSGTLTISGVGGVLVANTSASNSLTLTNNSNGTTLMNIDLPNSGTIDVTNAGASVIINSAMSGAGNITKTGAGVLTLTGNNTFGTGPGPVLTVSSGTLRSGANTTSAVTGGAVQIDAATVDVGGVGTFGTFTLGGLNANNGSVFNFDLGAGVQDQISLGANALTLSGTSTINVAGTFNPGEYTLLSYGSASGGAFALGSTPGGFTYELLTNPTATILKVIGTNAALTWSGAVDGNWDTTTANWSGNASGVFTNDDFVTFNDAGNNTNINISVPTVAPQAVTFNNTAAKDYTISGGSMVDPSVGPTALTKNGSGKVTLLNTNTISGPVAINEGTLAIGSGAAIGTVAGVTISGGAALESAGATVSTDRVINFSTGGGTISTPAGNDMTITSGLTGTSLATKTGAGTLSLTAAGTGKSGGFAVNGGTLKVSAVDENGVTGVGTGTVTTAGGATFQIDNVRVGFQADGTTPGTGLTVTTLSGGTLRGTGGNAGIQGSVRFQNNAPDPVTIDVPNAGDKLVTGNSIRNVSNPGAGNSSSTVLNVTGNGHLHNASGGTSLNSDQFSGTWNINMGETGITSFGPILNGGFGEVLNGPGYTTPGGSNAAYNGETRPITVNSGTLAFGADQPNQRPASTGGNVPAVISYRSPLTLNGGSIASTGQTYSGGDPIGGNVTANLHGSITVAGASSVKLFDPVIGAAGGSRNLNVMTDPNAINPDATPVPNDLTWGAAGNLSTVGVTGGTPGRLRFARSAGTVAVDAGAQLTIGENTVVELAGTTDALSDGADHVNVNNNGALEVTAGVKNVGGIGGTSGTVTVAPGATLNTNHVRGAALTVTDATVLIRDTEGQSAGVSKVDDYTLNGAAKIDLRDNKLVTEKPVGNFTGGAYTGVQGDVQRAYNFGAWDQPGLTTSEENAGQNAGVLSNTETIGVATASQVLFIEPTQTALFQGQTVTGASTIAMYTYAGDLNFDGLVDGADYGVIDNSVQFPGTDGYVNGDFNYDGVIDGADYGIIDNTIQLQGAPFPGVVFGAGAAGAAGGLTAVPEPSSLAGAAVGAAALLLRVRRRHRHPRHSASAGSKS